MGGFMDDVLDLRWRHKIPLPFLATLPLLLVYHASGSETGVMVPNQLRGLLGDYLDLGIFFYAFLLTLAVFSTHAINIYAGVNGLEVGQSVVIAVSVLLLNIVQLPHPREVCRVPGAASAVVVPDRSLPLGEPLAAATELVAF